VATLGVAFVGSWGLVVGITLAASGHVGVAMAVAFAIGVVGLVLAAWAFARAVQHGRNAKMGEEEASAGALESQRWSSVQLGTSNTSGRLSPGWSTELGVVRPKPVKVKGKGKGRARVVSRSPPPRSLVPSDSASQLLAGNGRFRS
jgi:hypothetical protein